jgi:hypothetical protein
LVNVGRVEPIGQQRHPVAGWDYQVALNPHRMRVAELYTERSTEKAH